MRGILRIKSPSGKTAARPEPKQPPPKAPAAEPADATAGPKEIGGREGPEPTRYGDWEVKGICVDF